jgi:NAD(P)-dependent dehydrogenase (short-subunit alcohol dehydrogenase family)
MIVDVGDEEQVTDTMTEVAGQYGRLDSCFANAGYSTPPAALLDTSLADFRAATRVDLDGAFTTLREAARRMVAAGIGGSLVATLSMSVLRGMACNYAYAASKAALVAVIKGSGGCARTPWDPGQCAAAELDRERRHRQPVRRRDVHPQGPAACRCGAR